MRDFAMTKAAVRAILDKWEAYEWSVQGFGMLRTCLDPDKRFRLNIWDSSLAVPNVSVIHDHPWDFDSVVLAGEFTNVRYDVLSINWPQTSQGEQVFHRAMIKCGPGGGMENAAIDTVALRPRRPEIITPGHTYSQYAAEIHASLYVDGTVTLNDRKRKADPDHAFVFWPYGQEWVDAEPRPATKAECDAITRACILMDHPL